MANNTWIGGTTAVAQIWKGTVTDTTSTHTYTLPVQDENGASITFSYTVTGGDTTATILAASIATAWNANTDYRLTPVTASSVAGQLILTADVAGTAFYIGTPGGTGSWTGTGNTTASVGPTDWNTAANWSTGVAPVNSDSVYLDGSATTDITQGLNQSSLDTITLYSKLEFLKSLGTANYSLKTGNNWVEYLGDTNNPSQPGAGSPRFKINHGTNTNTTTVYRSGSVAASDAGRAALQISGGSSSSKLYIVGGARVEVAGGNSETASFSLVANSGQSSSVTVGSGTTLVTLNCSAGTTVANCAMTTLSTTAGSTVTTKGSGAITTANIGGNANLNSTGTITTLNVYEGGTADFSNNLASRTVTTANQYAGGTIKVNSANPSHVTLGTHNKINGGTIKVTA